MTVAEEPVRVKGRPRTSAAEVARRLQVAKQFRERVIAANRDGSARMIGRVCTKLGLTVKYTDLCNNSSQYYTGDAIPIAEVEVFLYLYVLYSYFNEPCTTHVPYLVLLT